MDVDRVVDIPDTPDRITAQHTNGTHFIKERNSSVAAQSTTSDYRIRKCLNEPKPRSGPVSVNGHSRKEHSEFEPANGSTYSSLQNSNSSQKFPLFRGAPIVNNSKLESRPSTRMHLDKGKAKCNKVSSKLPASIDEDAIFNMAFPYSGSKAEERKDVMVSSSSPVISRNAVKGKGKLDINSCNGFGLSMNDRRGTGSSSDLPQKMGKQDYPSYPSVSSPRFTGHKRLVRNGCISPHNIVSRGKNVAEIHNVDSSDVRKVHSSNMGADAQSEVPIEKIVAEENNNEIDCYRAKGKGAMIYSSMPKELDRELSHAFNR